MSHKTQDWINKISPKIGWYLTGFVDGEGSFTVSLRRKKDYELAWQVTLTFNVAQRDITNLVLLKKHLGCGRLQARPDGVHYFVVGNYHMICERILPFFQKFYFFSSSKKKNFSLFKRIAHIVEKGLHLDANGFQEIVRLREELNKGRGRRRKYTQKDVKRHFQRILRD